MKTAKLPPCMPVFVAALAVVLHLGVPLHAQVVQPVAVRHVAPAPDTAGGQHASEPPRSTGRRILRVAGGAVLGAAIGGAAGYTVAAVRCGRRPGCSPTASYPYLRFGAVAGAVVGGGIAHGESGVAPSRDRVAAGIVRVLAANAVSWLAGGQAGRTAGLAAQLPLPATR